uniref:SKP1 component POZ domain-containing protein n=1 Tax=Pavo cristatus TaxID=9049 RepID=A0A8C9FZS0_PAVCR
MPSIKLQSSDGEIFEVDVEIAKQSVTIKTMLEGKAVQLREQGLQQCSRAGFVTKGGSWHCAAGGGFCLVSEQLEQFLVQLQCCLG